MIRCLFTSMSQTLMAKQTNLFNGSFGHYTRLYHEAQEIGYHEGSGEASE